MSFKPFLAPLIYIETFSFYFLPLDQLHISRQFMVDIFADSLFSNHQYCFYYSRLHNQLCGIDRNFIWFVKGHICGYKANHHRWIPKAVLRWGWQILTQLIPTPSCQSLIAILEIKLFCFIHRQRTEIIQKLKKAVSWIKNEKQKLANLEN